MWRILMVGLLFGGQVRAQTLDSTVLLDEPLLPGVSWVWSAAGQLGWDRLCAFHRVESIELEPLSASGAA